MPSDHFSLPSYHFVVRVENKLIISNSLNCAAVYYSHSVYICVQSMEFSLNVLYDLENDLGAVFSSVFGPDTRELNKSIVMKNNKVVLGNFVVSVSGIFERIRTTLRSAAAYIEELKSDQFRSCSQSFEKFVWSQDDIALQKSLHYP